MSDLSCQYYQINFHQNERLYNGIPQPNPTRISKNDWHECISDDGDGRNEYFRLQQQKNECDRSNFDSLNLPAVYMPHEPGQLPVVSGQGIPLTFSEQPGDEVPHKLMEAVHLQL